MLNTDKQCEAFFVTKAIDKNLIFVKLFLFQLCFVKGLSSSWKILKLIKIYRSG